MHQSPNLSHKTTNNGQDGSSDHQREPPGAPTTPEGPKRNFTTINTPKLLKPEFPPSPDSLRINKVLDFKPHKLRKIGKLIVNDKTTLAPETPRYKIINDELVKQWNKTKIIDDDIDDIDVDSGNIPVMAMENPFLANDTKVRFHKNSTVDYANYNEYINKHSGKKILKKLNATQKAIKPKRLFSQGLIKQLKEFEIFNDEQPGDKT